MYVDKNRRKVYLVPLKEAFRLVVFGHSFVVTWCLRTYIGLRPYMVNVYIKERINDQTTICAGGVTGNTTYLGIHSIFGADQKGAWSLELTRGVHA